MKLIQRCLTFGFIGLIMSQMSLAANAHSVWINATRYNPGDSQSDGNGGKTTLLFGWGDFFPLHDFLKREQIGRFFLKTPTSKIEELNAGEGGFLATPVKLPETGTYLAGINLKANVRTQVIENGKTTVLSKPKNEVPAGVKVLGSTYSAQFAKAIINVGNISKLDKTAVTPLGQGLEIVPLENPIHLREGDYLPFQLFFNGKPLQKPAKDPEIKATYTGFSSEPDSTAWVGELDNNGIARMRLQRYGVWKIHVRYETDSLPKELEGKADKAAYGASLTFEVR